MERLLNESEFAKTWCNEYNGYERHLPVMNDGILFTQYTSRYDPDTHFIAELKYFSNEGEITLLSLLIFDNDMTNDFIKTYKIEPYTYTYCFRSQNISPEIKPFTYLPSINNVFIEESSLPICVVYKGNCDVPSVLKEYDTDMEYAVAKKLQNGEPITKLKSARN